MKAPVLSPEVLDGLRLIGDPGLPAAPVPRVSGDLAQYPVRLSWRTACFRRQFDAAARRAAESDANDYLTHVHGTYGANPGRDDRPRPRSVRALRRRDQRRTAA